jgi:hypothetical protein
MPKEKLTGVEPEENDTPLSYEAQLEADVQQAFDDVEQGDDGSDPSATSSGQPRDPKGRFAKRDGDGDPAEATDPADLKAADRRSSSMADPADPDKGQQTKEGEEQPPPAAPSGPPPGWSVASKAAWDALPEHIRADVIKREGEVQQGLAALRDYKDLKPYAEMATRSGTTLSAALQKYTTMENLARRDPAQGMMAIAHNMGLSQAQAAQLFAHLAGVLGVRPTNGSPSNGSRAPSTSDADQNDDPLMEVIGPALQRVLGPMAQKLGTLETHLTRQQTSQIEADRAVLDRLASDPKYRYYPELEEPIKSLLRAGLVPDTGNLESDFAAAYEMAAYQHPQVREALISERLKTKADEAKSKEKEAAARARAASRSITGSATDGTDVPSRGRRKGHSYDADLEADVRAAFESVAGRA